MRNRTQHIKVFLLGTLLILCFLSCKEEEEGILIWTDPETPLAQTYINPVWQPDLADPTVIAIDNGWFYAYGTQNSWASGITRLVPIIKSKDLIRWTDVGDALTTKPSWKENGGIWAPHITYDKGSSDQTPAYYLFYSISTWGDANPGIGVAKSVKPEGPFTDLGKVFDSNEIGVDNSIDPFYIAVGEGRAFSRYLFWGSFRGIYGIELESDMKTTKGEKFKIANNKFEATYIHEKDGYYYFLGSLGSCCDGLNSKYRIAVARATDIRGPYLDKNGNDINTPGVEGTLMLSGNEDVGFVGPGHNAGIFTDLNGEDWILYHAIMVSQPTFSFSGVTRRPLMLDNIVWENEWATIKNGNPSNTLQEGPVFEIRDTTSN